MTKQVFQTTFAGRELIVETGQVAKQANGAVVVRYGESTVLTAAVMSKKMATGDFFPLQEPVGIPEGDQLAVVHD